MTVSAANADAFPTRESPNESSKAICSSAANSEFHRGKAAFVEQLVTVARLNSKIDAGATSASDWERLVERRSHSPRRDRSRKLNRWP
ncbi:MAG: hypothetical protein K0S56_1485 [Microvirga sp.]|nr:hypothetical protein [Microvirga sp.]